MPETTRFLFYAMATRLWVIGLQKQMEAKSTGIIKSPYEEL